ncbi:MAG: hypothetical protein KIH01_01475 [Candidatus Freyarchaeota archaeon]|nr:hypothetical protein [Candidatus Jordarchaeia archaeon]
MEEIENYSIQWDVRITGRKMRVQIDASKRATDIRFLYLGFSEVFASLMPLINNLSQKCRDTKFSFLCNYTSLRKFLNELKTLSYAMLLCGGETPRFDQNPRLNAELINEIAGRDLAKVKSKRRLPLLAKMWKERISLLVELLSKNMSLLFLEYYLDGKLAEYPPQWLEEIANIVKEAKSLGFKVLFPLKEKSIYEILKQTSLDVTLVEQQSLKFYESLLEIACEKAQTCYSLFDIVGYLHGSPSPTYTDGTQKFLEELVSYGLLKKVEGKYVIEY